MQSLVVTNLQFCMACLVPAARLEKLFKRTCEWIDAIRPSHFGTWLFVFAGLGLAVMFNLVLYTSGAAGLLGSATRLEVVQVTDTTKLWLVQYSFAAWLMVVALICSSKSARSALTASQIV